MTKQRNLTKRYNCWLNQILTYDHCTAIQLHPGKIGHFGDVLPSQSLAVLLKKLNLTLECGPMPNVMVALPNIADALCSMTQSLADAHYLTAVQ